MKETKKDIENAILVIAKYIDEKNGEKVYQVLLKSDELPEITKIIVVDIFVNCVESSLKDVIVLASIELLRKYMIELNTKGFVNFEES